MNYRPYNKQALIAVMKHRDAARFSGESTAQGFKPSKAPAWWDVTKWGKWWETGAQELEKSAPGKLITAPIRLPASLVSATTRTIEQIPGIVGNVGKVLPILAVGAVVVGGVILWSKFSKGKKRAL